MLGKNEKVRPGDEEWYHSLKRHRRFVSNWVFKIFFLKTIHRVKQERTHDEPIVNQLMIREIVLYHQIHCLRPVTDGFW